MLKLARITEAFVLRGAVVVVSALRKDACLPSGFDWPSHSMSTVSFGRPAVRIAVPGRVLRMAAGIPPEPLY